MVEEVKTSEAVAELQNASEDEIKEVVERWFEATRTQGLKIGAQYIALGVANIIKQHLQKHTKPSYRDQERCIDDIIKFISVQLKNNDTEQNDSNEEYVNEGTPEENS